MSNGKNFEELNIIRSRLMGLAELVEEQESYELFEKDDMTQLNKKSFEQAAYFILKSMHHDYIKSLPWPVLNAKTSEMFLKELRKMVDVLRNKYPWGNIPNFQKSHLQDARPENDKVVDFLMKLTSLAIHVVSGIKPDEYTTESLQAQLRELEDERKEQLAKMKQLETEKRLIEKRDEELSQLLIEKKQELLAEGIIRSEADFTLNKLLEVKETLEKNLLHNLKKLEELQVALT